MHKLDRFIAEKALSELPRDLSEVEQAMYKSAMMDAEQKGSLKASATIFAIQCREIQLRWEQNE